MRNGSNRQGPDCPVFIGAGQLLGSSVDMSTWDRLGYPMAEGTQAGPNKDHRDYPSGVIRIAALDWLSRHTMTRNNGRTPMAKTTWSNPISHVFCRLFFCLFLFLSSVFPYTEPGPLDHRRTTMLPERRLIGRILFVTALRCRCHVLAEVPHCPDHDCKVAPQIPIRATPLIWRTSDCWTARSCTRASWT